MTPSVKQRRRIRRWRRVRPHGMSFLLGPSMSAALLVALAACGGGGGGGGGVAASAPPFIALSTGQSASVVIGQANITSAVTATTQSGLSGPQGNPVVVGDFLFVPDWNSHRVLRYSPVPTSNGVNADLVLGQPNFTSSSSGGLAGEFGQPVSVSSTNGKLLVAETTNNRVQIWNSLPTTNGAAADVVVGEPDFGAGGATCDATDVTGTWSATVTGNRLLVAASDRNRVMIWNSIPTSNGVPADLVLGQDSFTECLENDVNHNGLGDDLTLDATTLFYPKDVWSDGTRVIVADSQNYRVLIWNTFPTQNGQPADQVLGQPDMTTNNEIASASGFDLPQYATSNGTQIFVADTSVNRVLVWNSWPAADGVPADVVLGQQDFTSGSPATTATGMSAPSGLHVTDTLLFVSDKTNRRVLIFQGQ
jgi:hypothetical protein